MRLTVKIPWHPWFLGGVGFFFKFQRRGAVSDNRGKKKCTLRVNAKLHKMGFLHSTCHNKYNLSKFSVLPQSSQKEKNGENG